MWETSERAPAPLPVSRARESARAALGSCGTAAELLSAQPWQAWIQQELGCRGEAQAPLVTPPLPPGTSQQRQAPLRRHFANAPSLGGHPLPREMRGGICVCGRNCREQRCSFAPGAERGRHSKKGPVAIRRTIFCNVFIGSVSHADGLERRNSCL